MQEQKTATLTTVFSEVLADLAFMFTDGDESDMPAGEVWLETVIGYQGAATGTLRLRCTRGFSIRLAANLLGTDADGENVEEQANDSVKEFMNIVCGQFITAVHGTGEVFDLTIPVISELPDTPDLTTGEQQDASVFSADGHLIQLSHLPGELPASVHVQPVAE